MTTLTAVTMLCVTCMVMVINILNVCLNTERVMMMMMACAPMSPIPLHIPPVKWKVEEKCAQTSHLCLMI